MPVNHAILEEELRAALRLVLPAGYNYTLIVSSPYTPGGDTRFLSMASDVDHVYDHLTRTLAEYKRDRRANAERRT